MEDGTWNGTDVLIQAFHEINEAVVSQQELNKILDIILDKALNIVGCPIGWLCLVNKKTGRLDIVVHRELPEMQRRTNVTMGKGITGWVAKTGRTLNIPDVSEDGRYHKLVDWTKSELCVPLLFHGRTIGVLNIESPDKGAFSEHDEKMLATFAGEAVIAIEMAKRFERTRTELKRKVKELESLREIDKALSSSLDLDAVLNLILDSALKLTETREGLGLVQLVDKTAGELVIRASRGLSDDESNTRFKIGEQGITGLVAKTKKPALIRDVTQEPWSDYYVALNPNVKSEVDIPLLSEDKVIGVLNLTSAQLDTFDEDDVRVLQTLAGQAVIAIQNAAQYEDLQKTHRELQEEQDKRIALKKWETLGKAAASLAHRLNNTIGIIPVCVQELSDLVGDDPDVRENLEIIDRNAKFTLELAENLLRPSKPSPIGLFDINLLLRQAVEVANVPHHINVLTAYDNALPKVRTSKLLVDMFVELIVNATKAMPSGGELELSTRCVNDKWVEIRFADTGCGIPADNCDKVFDLFFVSREESKPTKSVGFGLWWLKTYLSQQGGEIILESKVGKGSTFVIKLLVSKGKQGHE